MLKENRKKYHHGDLKHGSGRGRAGGAGREGARALSLRSIAARVGVSHTAPKNHFDGLRGLLTAIATVGFERHAAEMRRGVEDQPPAGAPAMRPATAMSLCAGEPGALQADVLQHALQRRRSGPEARGLGQLRGAARRRPWPRLGQGGCARRPWRTEWMLWSMVHGYAMLLIEGQIRRNEDGTVPR
jgi:AcrR family transcriptional regulator